MMSRKSKKVSREYLEEIEEYNSIKNNKNNDPLSTIRIDIKPRTENQKKLMDSIRDNDVTLAIGPAGSGKTFIACAQALKLLKEHPDKYKKILLVKSITQLKDENIGALPGELDSKLQFILASYMDSFYKLIGEGLTKKLIELNIIKFELLGSIRGRSFSNVILISDEHQNISVDNSRTLLTRISDDTKYIIMGDGEQVDLKNKKDSSLEFIAQKMEEKQVEGVGVIRLVDKDIIRHKLTSYFLNLFR
jgi:phosphate starvation-inducible PhoH-like protein